MQNSRFPLVFFLCFILGNAAYSQKRGQAVIDSLLLEIPKGTDDTNKVNLLNAVSYNYCSINPDEGLKYGREALRLAGRLNWKNGLAAANNNLGNNYENKSDYPKALESFQAALKINETEGNKNGIASVDGNIGIVYQNLADYPKALTYNFKALEIYEKANDKRGVARINAGIGLIYQNLYDYTKALDYDSRALKIYDETRDNIGIARVTSNIGLVHEKQGDYPGALEFYLKAKKIYEDAGNKMSIAVVTHNIGDVYTREKNYTMGTAYLRQSLEICEQLGNKTGIAGNLCNIGECYLFIIKDMANPDATGNIKNELPERKYIADGRLPKGKAALLRGAIDSLTKSLAISTDLQILDLQEECYSGLTDAFKLSGDYKKAMEYSDDYRAIKDSMFSKENNEQIVKMELKNEYDRKRLSDSLKADEKDKIAHIRLQRQRGYTYMGMTGVLLLLVFTFFIAKERRKSERLLKEIQKKNKEITDNINYAQRIQSAILPDIKLIYKTLEHSFILFLPKDIVSGDFYAFSEQDHKVLIIAGDCTGHGVSGALMSMIASSLLNQVINENELATPAYLLHRLNTLVIETLHQNENESASADGMDISVCLFDLNKNELQYAGANRPLWLVRDNNIEVYKPNKFPIGGLQSSRDRNFNNYEIKLQKNDTVYLFTDGYADQFGGEKGKKLMTPKFKETLLALQSLNMREQEQHLKDFFEQWKGKQEQVDDVLVIGVRIK